MNAKSTLACVVTWKWRFSPRCDFYFNSIFPARGETDRSSCAGSGPHLLLESIVESNIVSLSSPSGCIDHVYMPFSASVFSSSECLLISIKTHADFHHWNVAWFLSLSVFLKNLIRLAKKFVHNFVTKDVNPVSCYSTPFELTYTTCAFGECQLGPKCDVTT